MSQASPQEISDKHEPLSGIESAMENIRNDKFFIPGRFVATMTELRAWNPTMGTDQSAKELYAEIRTTLRELMAHRTRLQTNLETPLQRDTFSKHGIAVIDIILEKLDTLLSETTAQIETAERALLKMPGANETPPEVQRATAINDHMRIILEKLLPPILERDLDMTPYKKLTQLTPEIEQDFRTAITKLAGTVREHQPYPEWFHEREAWMKRISERKGIDLFTLVNAIAGLRQKS